jgi:hypothetical protein
MRHVLFVAWGWTLVGMAELSADELTTVRPSHRRAAIEKKLDQPLQWDLSDREQATLAEFIEFVQEKHGVRIRWDAKSLALFQGEQSPLAGLIPVPASQPTYYPTPYVSDPITAPPSYAGEVAQLSAPPEPKPVASPDKQQPAPAEPSDSHSPPLPVAPLPVAPPGVGAAPPQFPSVSPSGNGPPVIEEPGSAPDTVGSADELITSYKEAPIAVSALSLEQATVREGLEQMLDALPTAAGPGLQIGLPITTRALDLDLLVDENSVLITTQLRANAAKETRVYRLGDLSETPPETLVRVITHSVRPWSWRGQVHEIAERLASRWPKTLLPLPKVEINMTEGVKLASSEGVEPQPATAFSGAASEETVAATGQLLAGGAVAAVDSVVAALEIVHYGDPPTGVIEVLPGTLVITQSQGAHREIEQLLNALREGK